jgi:Phosphoesterase family
VNLDKPYPGFPEIIENSACVDFPTIFDELDAANVSWGYYAPYQDSLWNAPNGIRHLYGSSEFKSNVIYPESTILHDIATGHLAGVSYVVPNPKNSDHPIHAGSQGPNWVGTVLNAIGESQYWNKQRSSWFGMTGAAGTTASRRTPLPGFPPIHMNTACACRSSPCLPTCGSGDFIDHTNRDFTSILRFTGRDFRLETLTVIDGATDDLSVMFNFDAAQPLPYMPVDTHGFRPDPVQHRGTSYGGTEPKAD